MSEPLYVMAVLLSSGIALAVVTWMRAHDLDPAGWVFTAMLGCYPLVGAYVVAELVASTRDLAVVFYNLHSAVDAIAQAHGWSVRMTEGSEGGARVEFTDVDVVEEAPAIASNQTG